MKRAALAVAILVLFALSAMIAVVILVDPNDYKDEISEAVSAATGRHFQISGDMDLSVFPWLGFELNDVYLDNLPDFTHEHFAKIARLNVKAALLPLFALQVEIGEIQLKGLQANLERRIDGSNNWDDLISKQNESSEIIAAESASSAQQETVEFPVQEFYVGGIKIDDAEISWSDAQKNIQAKIEYFNLETGAIRLGEQISFDLRFALRNENPKVIAGIEMHGQAAFDPIAQLYSIHELTLEAKASGTAVPGNDMEIILNVKGLIADLAKQSIDVNFLEFETAGVAATLKLDAQQIFEESLEVSGDLSLKVASVRSLFGLLAQPIPLTTDDEVLSALILTSQFKGGLDSIKLNNLIVVFDDSRLQGEVDVKKFAKPVIHYELVLDQIDADRYLPPPLEDEVDIVAAAVPTHSPVEYSEPELPVPVDLLRDLNATGDLQINSLQIMNLKLADVKAGLNANNGKVKLNPLSLNLYDGQFNGNALIDVSSDLPVYSGDLNLANVQSGPLLLDYMGKRLLEGKMNAKGNLESRGTRISELKQTLNGVLDLTFKDGTLSTDTRQRLRERKAELKQKLSGETTDVSSPIGEPTKFSSITAKATVEKGIVSNDDLQVRARKMYVTGRGRFEIPSNYIDYVLTVLLSDDGAGQDDPLDELIDFPIEYELQGKLEELDYAKITRKALANAAKAKLKQGFKIKEDVAKAKLEEQKRAALEKEKAELEQRKIEVEERARKQLKEKRNKLLERMLSK